MTSIRTEVTKLESQGVNKIIAVGHAGFSVDKKIASEVVGVDIVVGGHTNTFLYNGKHTKRKRRGSGTTINKAWTKLLRRGFDNHKSLYIHAII